MTFSPFSIVASYAEARAASNEFETRLRFASGRCNHVEIQEQA
jgi:hypothetical protein